MKTVCQVCMHHCTLSPGQMGICRARENVNGKIECTNYGRITSLALDPIEKKPLHMFYPRSLVLSVGSFGCNLRCPFCQNHEISMTDSEGIQTIEMTPQMLANKALAYKDAGNIGVAYTYNEPLIGWEYVRDTAVLVKEAGMKNVLVTNGTAQLSILEELLPYIDAMNIDLKGFQQKYYEKLGGSLETVKEFIIRAVADCHVELTTLIVPGENDKISEMEEEAAWIASVEDAAGKTIPLHVTRFFPRYHMFDREATDIAQIHRLADIAKKYLNYVFVGNC
ncbi:MAG: AmmeMemoRadiSam system radical SAM enzyme [Lachnospiraceae bacterium]|nr:AmmeMemoRadiSam system radical SAM enzyme [Lachnospiraceae bacterium]